MGTNKVIHFNYEQSQPTIKTILAATLIWGLLSTLGWALPMVDTASDSTRQQTISMDKSAQTKPINSDSSPVQPTLTQDFLNDSPLSHPTPHKTPGIAPDVSIVAVKGAGRECSSTGDQSQGSQSCLTRNADASFSESTADWEKFGDEEKAQTVTRHYNSNGESEGEDTQRIKTNYRSNSEGSKQKEREFYDIIHQPPQGLISRDLIVKEYDKKGVIKKITWAHYLEIGTRKAGLAHHAVLYYENGKLASGFANKYKGGKVVDTLLNYDPTKNPNLRMEKTGALKWSGWIDQLIHTTSAVKL